MFYLNGVFNFGEFYTLELVFRRVAWISDVNWALIDCVLEKSLFLDVGREKYRLASWSPKWMELLCDDTFMGCTTWVRSIWWWLVESHNCMVFQCLIFLSSYFYHRKMNVHILPYLNSLAWKSQLIVFCWMFSNILCYFLFLNISIQLL